MKIAGEVPCYVNIVVWTDAQPACRTLTSTLRVSLVECAKPMCPEEISGTGKLGHKDNMGWSGWEEFRNLTPNDKTNLQEQK